MAAPFPHQYEVRLEGDGPAGVLSAPARPAILGGAPPEFDGQEHWWSPEHLLLSSVALCLMTTFRALARRAGVEVRAYSSRAKGLLDKTAGGLGFTSIALEVTVEVAAEERGRAEQLLAAAKKHCIVSNALKPAVELHGEVRAA